MFAWSRTVALCLHDSVDLVLPLYLILILDYLTLKPFSLNNNGIPGIGDPFDLRLYQVELPHFARELSLEFSYSLDGLTQANGHLHLSGVVLHARNINLVFKGGKTRAMLFVPIVLDRPKVLDLLIGDLEIVLT